MSTIHHTLESGTYVDCYEIGQVLGVGGFGITYKGYDHTLSCDVAIKEYLPSGVALRTDDGITVVPKTNEDVDFYSYGLDRFLDEARILAKFRERSIVRVSRFLQGNGTAYLVMDYEKGQPLNAFLKSNGLLSEEQIVSILIPVLRGLGEVHNKGYMHRDIKPANIYLREDGSPVLLDFGAARQSMGGHTQAVTSMVTPGYAPIEQYNTTGKQGPWTDFYGLGATLYRCISGDSPVGAPDRVMALHAGDADPMTAATIVGKGKYSDNLLQVIDWMLQPNIADRPQHIDAIRQRLPNEPVKFSATGNATNVVPDINTNSEMHSLTQWRREELEEISQQLANYIGPMARVLVKEACVQIKDKAELYRKLAENITTEADKDAFLQAMAKISDTPMPAVIADAPVNRPATPAAHPAQARIPGEMIKRAETQLANFIGPLAKMIVQRTANNCRGLDDFIERLANEIDSVSEREHFVKQMKH